MNKKLPIICLLLFILISCSYSLLSKSLSYDEAVHWKYGLNISQGQSDRLYYPQYIDDSKMPISAINAIPCILTTCSKLDPKVNIRGFSYKDLNLARLMTVLFSCLLGYFIFFWSNKWYGYRSGILSLTLYAFCPNILAHSQFVTTDIYSAGFVTFAIYYFWLFINEGGKGKAFLSACMLGLAQTSKYTCLYLYPLFLIIIAIKYIPIIYQHLIRREYLLLLKTSFRFLKFFFLFIFINLIIINAAYFFNKTLTPLKDYQLYSESLLKIQANPLLGSIPVPLPYPYIQGIDRSKFNERTGSSIGNLYLLGKLQEVRTEQYKGFKGYYLIVSLFKVPIATLIICFLTVWMYLKYRKIHRFLQKEIFLIIPIIFFIIYLNFMYRMHIGIRHFLIIFPLIFIFCGSLISEISKPSKISLLVIKGLCIYLMLSVCSFYPYFLSYVNESVINRKQSYKIFADSNLDIGCNTLVLQTFLKNNPTIIYEPSQPTAGTIIVSINSLVGLFDKEQFRWLRENFEPDDHLAYSFLIYHINQNDLARIF